MSEELNLHEEGNSIDTTVPETLPTVEIESNTKAEEDIREVQNKENEFLDSFKQLEKMKLFIFTERVIKDINNILGQCDIYYGIFITDDDNNITYTILNKFKNYHSSTAQYTAFKIGIEILLESGIKNIKVYVKDKRFTRKLMQSTSFYKIKENKPLVDEIKSKLTGINIKITPMGKMLFKKSEKLTNDIKLVWQKYIEGEDEEQDIN